MPIRTQLWEVAEKPRSLRASQLESEIFLEEMIVREPKLLSDDWMLIGRQEVGSGGKIDLLAVAPDASLVLIELKRDKTTRDVVAQALDYAVWVESLQADDIASIYQRFSAGRELAADFEAKFGFELDEDELNHTHQIIIVASELDARTERIVAYLNDRGVAANVLFFQVFEAAGRQILSRSWLLDPVETQSAASRTIRRDSEPWNGEFFCSFGHGESRSWEEAVEFGFVCGGGGAWYSRTLSQLEPGSRVWARVPSIGYVGVGIVQGESRVANEFTVEKDGREVPALSVLHKGTYHREYAEDDELAEYFVPIRWLDTRALSEAIQEVGFFGNQNTVCKPTTPKWRTTIERLKTQLKWKE